MVFFFIKTENWKFPKNYFVGRLFGRHDLLRISKPFWCISIYSSFFFKSYYSWRPDIRGNTKGKSWWAYKKAAFFPNLYWLALIDRFWPRGNGLVGLPCRQFLETSLTGNFKQTARMDRQTAGSLTVKWTDRQAVWQATWEQAGSLTVK